MPWFSVILGGLLIIFGGLSLTGIDLQIPEGQENHWGILVGIVGGLMLGMTGIFSVPSVFYLYGLKLTRDELVQALGIVLNIVTVFSGNSTVPHGNALRKTVTLIHWRIVWYSLRNGDWTTDSSTHLRRTLPKNFSEFPDDSWDVHHHECF